MRSLFFFLMSLSVSISLASQTCYPFGIAFNTQDAIDNFQANNPGCTQILGNTIISGTDITNLNGLSVLTSLGQNFTIHSCSALTDLTGLDGITSIARNLSIFNNALTSLNGLDNLVSVGGHLEIRFNNTLTSLAGLDNINSGNITNLTITNNNLLSFCEVASICSYLMTSTNSATISGNASGCTDRQEVETACNISLPVELSSFSGKVDNQDRVHLYWSTGSELNNKGFQIQHSTDAIVWSDLTFISGASNTTLSTEYEYVHSLPVKGENYYRLMQIDFDGEEYFSEAIQISIEHDKHFNIYPNPVSDRLIFEIHDRHNPKGYIELINQITGQLIKTKDFSGQSFSMNLGGLPSGIYLIQIHTQSQIRTYRILKE